MDTLDHLYDTVFKPVVEGVLYSLLASPNRTFAAEHAIIFAMYYETANATTRANMRALVASGALEFTGGGWVQPDEAITRHEDLFDQLTLGRAFITQTLGHQPLTTVWIADPFGHSTSSAAMHAASSSDLLVIGRTMSPLDPFTRQSGVVWHPTASLPKGKAPTGKSSSSAAASSAAATTTTTNGGFEPGRSILTQEYNVYCDPYRGMRNDMTSGKVDASVKAMLDFVDSAAAVPPLRTEVLVMFGDDAPNESPFPAMYDAMDALVDAINALTPSTNISISYSTPSRYVAALARSILTGGTSSSGRRTIEDGNGEQQEQEQEQDEGKKKEETPPEFTQPYPSRPAWDMFPLVGNEFPYWVGYYTSRPELKQAVHGASALFRAATQLHALARNAGVCMRGGGRRCGVVALLAVVMGWVRVVLVVAAEAMLLLWLALCAWVRLGGASSYTVGGVPRSDVACAARGKTFPLPLLCCPCLSF